MNFNYNVNPIDFGAYYQGLNDYQKRQANDLLIQQQKAATEQQGQLQPLIQSYLGGDTSALNKIAAIDSGKAAELQKLVDSQKKAFEDPFAKEGFKDMEELYALGANGSQLFTPKLQTMLQKYQGTPYGESLTQWTQQLQQDPTAAMQALANDVQVGRSLLAPKEEKVGRYQRQVMGENLAIIDSATGQIVREYPIPQTQQQKAQLAKMTADIDKAESEAQLKARLAQTEEEKKQSSIDMANEALTVIDQVVKHPNFSNAVGTVDTMLPTVRGETQDVINMAMRLNSLLTVDNLKLMSGVLTDRDIKFLTDVASGLNITENGIKGSEKGVRKRLDEIAGKIREGLSKSAANGAPTGAANQQRSEKDILKQYGIE